MAEKTTIYFIRHGECAGNRERRIRGCADFPLNDNGVRQAEALSECLAGRGIEHIVTSPLTRAMMTAEILGERLGIRPVIKEGFKNISFGPWENRLQSEITAEFPEMWHTWLTDPESLRVRGAESVWEVRRRSLRELEMTAAEYAGKTIALVSHRALLKPMLAGALGIERPCFWRLHLDNAAYGVLTHDTKKGFCLCGLNYTRHLEKLEIVNDFDSM